MTLTGRGAVAIWHDIAPEGREAFYAWHGLEHMAERVGIPGFLRGRRFIAIDADREFFNLYETTDGSVVAGEEYRRRLDNPTPWTLAMVPHFRSVARSLTEVTFSRGDADGGMVATLRYDVPDARIADHKAAMTGSILPAIAEGEGVAAVHLLVADMTASGEVNAEQRARGGHNEVPRFVAIVEGWAEQAPFMARVREAFSAERLAAAGVANRVDPGFYRHQITRFSTLQPAEALDSVGR